MPPACSAADLGAVLSEGLLIFAGWQPWGSGPCLLPVLGAGSFPEFLRMPSFPHQVWTQQAQQNSLKGSPTATKKSKVFSRRHLTSPYFAPSLRAPTVFQTPISASCWKQTLQAEGRPALTALPSFTPLQPQPSVNTDTLHLSDFCFDLVPTAVKKPRIS